jgi:NADPH:quinone reductase
MQRVTRSTIIDAPIERVWAVLRDFNSHARWHDAVEASRIEGHERSDQVGCVRNFTLRDGNRIREQLLSLSDNEHRSTYCIVESTVPLQRYVASVTLKPVTDGNRTFWHWESSFTTPPGRERELHDLVAQGVYETGFSNLRRHLQQGADLRPRAQPPMPTALSVPTRRMVVAQYGETAVLQAEDAEAGAPAQGEVRIQQRAIGVNFLDVYLRRGWIAPMFPLPGVLGMEAAGTVLDVGANVNGLLPGDRVAYLGPVPGAYCGMRSVPQ